MTKHQNLAIILLSAGFLTLGATGCQRNESPEKTQNDVSNAAMEGAQDAAEARHDAAESTMNAQKELAHESAEGRQEIAKADAAAQHKVALEACESLTGDAQSACKKKADLDYDQAKLAADTRKTVEDPKN